VTCRTRRRSREEPSTGWIRQLVAHVQERPEARLVGAPGLEQLRVADRDRGLRGQPREAGLVPIAERPRRAVVHDEQPFDSRLGLDRHGQRGLDAVSLDQRLRVVPEPRIVRIVLRPKRPAGQQHLAGEPLARHEPFDRRHGSAGPVAEQHRLGRRVAGRDDAEIGSAELARRPRTHLPKMVRGVRGGDLVAVLAPAAGALSPRRGAPGARSARRERAPRRCRAPSWSPI
jgi:hypothetical protein